MASQPEVKADQALPVIQAAKVGYVDASMHAEMKFLGSYFVTKQQDE